MGLISTTGRAVFRDYVTDGVPSSGPQSPVKADIRSLFDLVDTSVDAIWANVVADGVTNDHDALQTAIDAGIAQGRAVRFRGKCYVGGQLTITGTVDFGGMVDPFGLSIFQGHGTVGHGSWLYFADDVYGIVVDTPLPVKLHDFAISPISGATSTGAGIYVTDSGDYINQSSIFDNIFVSNFETAFYFYKAGAWHMSRCNGISGLIGFRISDALNPDGGDSTCIGNIFNSFSLQGVLYESAGGLKFSDNKTNGCPTGFELRLVEGGSTGQLSIVGNSFDQCNYGIILGRAAGATTGGFGAIEIAANVIVGTPKGIYAPNWAPGIAIFGLAITGNYIQVFNGDCIDIDSATGVSVVGNVLRSVGSGGISIIFRSGVSYSNVGFNARIGSSLEDLIASGAIGPTDIPFCSGYSMIDGIAPPATRSGYAQIYVDTSDGDLKVKFGDGTVKTIVVDT